MHYSNPSPTSLSPSEILQEIREKSPILGYALTHKAIYSALRRLEEKGVVRVGQGKYILNPYLVEEEPFYVENLRIDGKLV